MYNTLKLYQNISVFSIRAKLLNWLYTFLNNIYVLSYEKKIDKSKYTIEKFLYESIKYIRQDEKPEIKEVEVEINNQKNNLSNSLIQTVEKTKAFELIVHKLILIRIKKEMYLLFRNLHIDV